MSNFKLWIILNQDAITWFVIGFCTSTAAMCLSVGIWVGAAVNAGFALLNFLLSKQRLTNE